MENELEQRPERRSRPKGLAKVIGASMLAGLLILGAYLMFGWGLGQSSRQASYRLVGYWTEAGGTSFDQPYGIAVDARNGNVLITDARNQRVVVFSSQGDVVRVFGEEGDGPGQFALPVGVAVGPDGAIYVADYIQDRVQKFSPGGEFVRQWGGSTGGTQLNSPIGLAMDEQGNVYVSDFYNNVVKVFSPEGEFLGRVGRPGHWRPGQLDYPTDVDVNADGRVLVADAYNYRLQRFDADWQPQAAWGWHVLWLLPRPAGGDNGFGEATGAAFGGDTGLMHVADARNYRVAMLDEQGRFVTDYTLSHRRGGPYAPMQVAVSADGATLYATDIANNRVLILAIEEQQKVAR
ncbi:MAG: 6-bladed beta-propeller [Gammaproteobacteria bacterium]|nr:6-bladed beta-propeller [Gammaproteobacteria bacterium]